MTVEEFRKLKTGDVVSFIGKHFTIVSNECLGVNVRYNLRDPDHNIIVIEFSSNDFCFCDIDIYGYCFNGKHRFKNFSDITFIKIDKDKLKETELSTKITEKETELENLKKEYEEIKRKKMLDRIVPGNVYRFTYNEETYVRLIREIYESKIYTTDLVRAHPDSFYIDGFENVEHLPELTEAYKNFKTLLHS